jgi:hypothetical protein
VAEQTTLVQPETFDVPAVQSMETIPVDIPAPAYYAAPVQGPPLPPGWISQVDGATGRTFFVNTATGRSQWEPPGYSAGGYAVPPGAPRPTPILQPLPNTYAPGYVPTTNVYVPPVQKKHGGVLGTIFDAI